MPCAAMRSILPLLVSGLLADQDCHDWVRDPLGLKYDGNQRTAKTISNRFRVYKFERFFFW